MATKCGAFKEYPRDSDADRRAQQLAEEGRHVRTGTLISLLLKAEDLAATRVAMHLQDDSCSLLLVASRMPTPQEKNLPEIAPGLHQSSLRNAEVATVHEPRII